MLSKGIVERVDLKPKELLSFSKNPKPFILPAMSKSNQQNNSQQEIKQDQNMLKSNQKNEIEFIKMSENFEKEALGFNEIEYFDIEGRKVISKKTFFKTFFGEFCEFNIAQEECTNILNLILQKAKLLNLIILIDDTDEYDSLDTSSLFEISNLCQLYRSSYFPQALLASKAINEIFVIRDLMISLEPYGFLTYTNDEFEFDDNRFKEIKTVFMQSIALFSYSPDISIENQKKLNNIIIRCFLKLSCNFFPPYIPYVLLHDLDKFPMLPNNLLTQRLICIKSYLASNTEDTIYKLLFFTSKIQNIPSLLSSLQRRSPISYEENIELFSANYFNIRDEDNQSDESLSQAEKLTLLNRWGKCQYFSENEDFVLFLQFSIHQLIKNIFSTASLPDPNNAKLGLYSLQILRILCREIFQENKKNELLVELFRSSWSLLYTSIENQDFSGPINLFMEEALTIFFLSIIEFLEKYPNSLPFLYHDENCLFHFFSMKYFSNIFFSNGSIISFLKLYKKIIEQADLELKHKISFHKQMIYFYETHSNYQKDSINIKVFTEHIDIINIELIRLFGISFENENNENLSINEYSSLLTIISNKLSVILSDITLFHGYQYKYNLLSNILELHFTLEQLISPPVISSKDGTLESIDIFSLVKTRFINHIRHFNPSSFHFISQKLDFANIKLSLRQIISTLFSTLTFDGTTDIWEMSYLTLIHSLQKNILAKLDDDIFELFYQQLDVNKILKIKVSSVGIKDGLIVWFTNYLHGDIVLFDTILNPKNSCVDLYTLSTIPRGSHSSNIVQFIRVWIEFILSLTLMEESLIIHFAKAILSPFLEDSITTLDKVYPSKILISKHFNHLWPYQFLVDLNVEVLGVWVMSLFNLECRFQLFPQNLLAEKLYFMLRSLDSDHYHRWFILDNQQVSLEPNEFFSNIFPKLYMKLISSLKQSSIDDFYQVQFLDAIDLHYTLPTPLTITGKKVKREKIEKCVSFTKGLLESLLNVSLTFDISTFILLSLLSPSIPSLIRYELWESILDQQLVNLLNDNSLVDLNLTWLFTFPSKVSLSREIPILRVIIKGLSNLNSLKLNTGSNIPNCLITQVALYFLFDSSQTENSFTLSSKIIDLMKQLLLDPDYSDEILKLIFNKLIQSASLYSKPSIMNQIPERDLKELIFQTSSKLSHYSYSTIYSSDGLCLKDLITQYRSSILDI